MTKYGSTWAGPFENEGLALAKAQDKTTTREKWVVMWTGDGWYIIASPTVS